MAPVMGAGSAIIVMSRIESLARLRDLDAAAVARAVARHDALVGEAIARCGGVRDREFGGNGVVAVFARTADAVSAARAARRTEVRVDGASVAVRAALHASDGACRTDGDGAAAAVGRCGADLVSEQKWQVCVSGSSSCGAGMLPQCVGLAASSLRTTGSARSSRSENSRSVSDACSLRNSGPPRVNAREATVCICRRLSVSHRRAAARRTGKHAYTVRRADRRRVRRQPLHHLPPP
jgi:hypothetical protein